MNEPTPHCARCDIKECPATPLPGVLEGYIAQAGMKPREPIMRSAWEHGLMVWCRAQREIANDEAVSFLKMHAGK